MDKLALMFLLGILYFASSFSSAQAQSDEGVLSPPLFGEDASALPSVQTQDAAPGMRLPGSGSQGLMANPYAPVEEAEKTVDEVEAEIRAQSFDAAITGLLPLQPNEIRTLLERYDGVQQAVEVPIYPYPEPEMVVETVSLDPGTVPPVIKVAVGHVTTLSLLDVTGAPWPIQDMAWAGNFEIMGATEGGNIISITPMSEFAHGNISISLLELKTPVMFTIKTHRDVVQYRFDARIPKFGPFAEIPIIDGGITLVAGNKILSAVLDGVPPSGAEKLDVTGVDGRTTAYSYNDQTYVRTPLTLLSPGWSNSVSSADGMNVYTVANASVLLLSDRGVVVRVRLNSRDGGFDD